MSQSSSRQQLKQRRSRRRRQQTILIVVIVAVAVILAGLLIFISIPRNTTESASGEVNYEELTQEADQAGALGFAIGDPNAPATLLVYSDFSCPHCYDLSFVIHRIIGDLATRGQVRVVYKPIAFVNPPYSGPAATAAICAGQQGKFWQMHDQIWTLYGQYRSAGAYTRPALFGLAEDLGLDKDAFSACFDAPETAAEVQAVIDEALGMGIYGTPTLLVNGQQVYLTNIDTAYDTIKAAIEAAGS
jgi:protein-disulfide isomerase